MTQSNMQQSLNQFLYQTSLLTGVYGKTPEGRALFKNIQAKTAQSRAKKSEIEEVKQKNLEQVAKAKEEAYEANPTDKTYTEMQIAKAEVVPKEAESGKQTASQILGTDFRTKEDRGIKSYIDRATSLQEQKEAYAERKDIIINYSPMEVDENGTK